MDKSIEERIEREMRWYRQRGLTTEKLEDKYRTAKERYAEAVMLASGGAEEHYINKEAARRLLIEKGVRYEK